MGATTTQGTGPGSAEAYNKGPGNNRDIYAVLNGPHVVDAGIVTISGNPWKKTITFPKPLAMTPDHYVVMVMQSDITNSDGHGEYAPHVEKLDQYGNNQDAGFVGNMGGFVLHSGDNTDRTFMYLVVSTGFAG